jgi:ComEC/Rec2-related protein
MPKISAGIVFVFLMFAGIIVMREMDWLHSSSPLSGVNVVNLRFRITESIRMTMSNCIISHEGQGILIKRSICEVSGLQAAKVGDKIEVVGSWEEWMIEGTTDKKDWIIATKITIHPIELKPLISYWWWVRKLTRISKQISLIYSMNLPEPQSSLMAGIVIGEQQNLSSDFKEALKRTGTTHMVAASGYNVTVVAGVAMAFLVKWFGRKRGVMMTVLVVGMYIILAGSNPPIIRSGLMGMAMLIGVLFGREYWSGWALIIVSSLMLLIQPWLLLSVSFQLSFVATVGMIYGTKYKPNNIFLESLLTTLAATIMTAPISLITFGQVSLLGLIVNPLVLWLVSPLMYLGGAMAISGLIWLPLASVLAWLIAPIASMMVEIISIAGSIKMSSLILPCNWMMAFGWWMVWLSMWSIRSRNTRYEIGDTIREN